MMQRMNELKSLNKSFAISQNSNTPSIEIEVILSEEDRAEADPCPDHMLTAEASKQPVVAKTPFSRHNQSSLKSGSTGQNKSLVSSPNVTPMQQTQSEIKARNEIKADPGSTHQVDSMKNQHQSMHPKITLNMESPGK